MGGDLTADSSPLRRTPLYADKPPCVWIASHAPRMLALTGRYADGWYPTMKMTAKVLEIERQLAMRSRGSSSLQ